MANLASQMVVGGLTRVRLVFGIDGTPTPAAELLDAGSELFTDKADADAVGILMTNDRATVEVILGAVGRGGRLVSLPMPGRSADLREYAEFLKAVCVAHGLLEIVVADHWAGMFEAIGLPVRRHSELERRPLGISSADGFCLVQFTSGSTQDPKPVALDDLTLGANLGAILATVRPRPGDALVTWLPLAHDMGLVGMLMTGLAAGGPEWSGEGDVVILDPRDFLRRPGSWLEALSRWRGTFTAAPDFAFRMVTQRSRGASPGLDLSALRSVIVGGEIIRADTLSRFAALHRDAGFDPLAFCPAYGLAELGLAATLTPPGEMWRETTVSSASLSEDAIRSPRSEEPATTLVASGPALPGYSIAASGMSGGPAQLRVRGPSVGTDPTTGASLGDSEGWLATGDVGFVSDGWLYVCGRDDDYVVTHGRNVYAPPLEAAVASAVGVRAGRVAAVGRPTGEWVIVAELMDRSPLDDSAARALRREVRRLAVDVAGAAPDEVVLMAPGQLPLTSSGKLQRRVVRHRLLQGDLGG